MDFLTDEQIAALSFEEALQRLESAVKMLEDGGLPLDHAVKVFEEGNRLRKRCEQKLREAKLNVEKVIESAQEVEFEPFDRCA